MTPIEADQLNAGFWNISAFIFSAIAGMAAVLGVLGVRADRTKKRKEPRNG